MSTSGSVVSKSWESFSLPSDLFCFQEKQVKLVNYATRDVAVKNFTKWIFYLIIIQLPLGRSPRNPLYLTWTSDLLFLPAESFAAGGNLTNTLFIHSVLNFIFSPDIFPTSQWRKRLLFLLWHAAQTAVYTKFKLLYKSIGNCEATQL